MFYIFLTILNLISEKNKIKNLNFKLKRLILLIYSMILKSFFSFINLLINLFIIYLFKSLLTVLEMPILFDKFR